MVVMVSTLAKAFTTQYLILYTPKTLGNKTFQDPSIRNSCLRGVQDRRFLERAQKKKENKNWGSLAF